MKSKKELVNDTLEIAKKTIPTTYEHCQIAFKKGAELAKIYNVDLAIVLLGLYLMDSKIKEAKSLGEPKDHTIMASEFAKNFLKSYDITLEEYNKIKKQA